MREITEQYARLIEEETAETVLSANRVKDYVENSPLAYMNRCVKTLQIPKVFSEEEIGVFEGVVETMYRIAGKVIRRYINYPDYRKLFPFSKELEELILVPNLYDSVLPIARFDIFYHEDTENFVFCEINTDGTSAMNEDRILNQALKYNNIHQRMRDYYDFRTFELFDSWVDTCISLYRTYKKGVEQPYIAIVDFMYHTTMRELEEFKRRFEAFGYKTEICEIRNLTYEGGVLYSPTGHPIDLIYRRAVTTDVMQNYREVQPFIQAVLDQNVCVMGSFCTQIIHTKWFFKVVHDAGTQSFLTEEERDFVKKHIPFTNLLDRRFCSQREIVEDKDRWILKPMDSYASQGVFAGVDFNRYTWEEIVDRYFNNNYIYQEYHSPYRSMNGDYTSANVEAKPYTNMTGLFVYNGRLAGLYSRMSDGGIISSQYNEKTVPTLVASRKTGVEFGDEL